MGGIMSKTLLDIFGIKDAQFRRAEIMLSAHLIDGVKTYSCDIHLQNDPSQKYHRGCPPLPIDKFQEWLRKEFQQFTNIAFLISLKPINQLESAAEDVIKVIEAEGFKVLEYEEENEDAQTGEETATESCTEATD